MGTENGHEVLNYLDEEVGPERETLTDDEAFDCSNFNGMHLRRFVRRNRQCEMNVAGVRAEYLSQYVLWSFNSNRLISDQRREYLDMMGYDSSLNAQWWQYRGMVTLDNATMSSTSNDNIASNALKR